MEESVQRCNSSQMWMKLKEKKTITTRIVAHISSTICCAFMIFKTADTQHVLCSKCLHVNITSECGSITLICHRSQSIPRTVLYTRAYAELRNSRSLLNSSFIPLFAWIKRIVPIFSGDESRLKPQKYNRTTNKRTKRKPSHILTVGCSAYKLDIVLFLTSKLI